jgi:putative DNA primase/helicase
VRGTDDAIWWRIHLIPFTVQSPEHKRDPYLFQRLQGELSGILAWAVEGCREYLENGLKVPSQVRNATDAYKKEMDIIGDFIDERLESQAGTATEAAKLYAAYRDWCEKTGSPRFSMKRYCMSFEKRYEQKRTKRANAYLGVRVRGQR